MAGAASLHEAIRSATTSLVEALEDEASVCLRAVEAAADHHAGPEYTTALQATVAAVKKLTTQCANKELLPRDVRSRLAVHGLNVTRQLDKSARSRTERDIRDTQAMDTLFADTLRVARAVEAEGSGK